MGEPLMMVLYIFLRWSSWLGRKCRRIPVGQVRCYGIMADLYRVCTTGAFVPSRSPVGRQIGHDKSMLREVCFEFFDQPQRVGG